MAGILWAVAAVIVVLWLIGFFFRIAGNLIHVLLLVAIAVVIYNFVTGRRAI